MKTTGSVLLCLLMAVPSFAQKNINKNIIGTWEQTSMKVGGMGIYDYETMTFAWGEGLKGLFGTDSASEASRKNLEQGMTVAYYEFFDNNTCSFYEGGVSQLSKYDITNRKEKDFYDLTLTGEDDISSVYKINFEGAKNARIMILTIGIDNDGSETTTPDETSTITIKSRKLDQKGIAALQQKIEKENSNEAED